MKKVRLTSLFIIVCLLCSCHMNENTGNNHQVSSNTQNDQLTTQEKNLKKEASENNEKVEKKENEILDFETIPLMELEADFDYAINLLTTHNTFTFSDLDAFNELALEEKNKLYEGMTLLEFYQSISRLVSSIQCGHSGVYLPSNVSSMIRSEGVFFPFDVYLYQSDLYITKDFAESSIPLGAKIISINGLNSNQIIEEMYRYLMADGKNITLKQSYINEKFFYLYYLYIDQSPIYEIAYEIEGENETYSQSVDGAKYYKIYSNMSEVTDGSGVSYELEEDYGLLTIRTFNTVGNYSIPYYEMNFEAFFTQVKEEKIDKIMIDLRHAHGGDPNAAAILLRYLLNNDRTRYFRTDMPPFYPDLMEYLEVLEPHFDGKVFIIEDGECFSTTGHLLALMKYHNIGTIIGEESGGGYVVTDASFYEDLPNTKLRVWTSSVPWIVDTEGLVFGRGIEPDFPFVPTVEDVINHYDATLEYALRLLKETRD